MTVNTTSRYSILTLYIVNGNKMILDIFTIQCRQTASKSSATAGEFWGGKYFVKI
jgi:hypothetical protein